MGIKHAGIARQLLPKGIREINLQWNSVVKYKTYCKIRLNLGLRGYQKKMPKRTRGLKDLQFFAKAFLLSD